jgi:hypothetical protein|tara:strand:+ start:12888 stop:13610 length:723 start_codon:yes stop_codon:yes gene_type:complete
MRFLFIALICLVPLPEVAVKATPFAETIKGLDISFKMMPVQTEEELFWIARTELTWDLYDKYLQLVNSSENLHAGIDAITGPTPAYALVDRGYGRQGYPAISMSAKAAEAFCKWLSNETGRTYNIPTIEQWKMADANGGTTWNKETAENKTHPVTSSTPNELGIFDMRGNVGEWVLTKDGPRVIGGSFRTPPEKLGRLSLLTPKKAWNETDPQLPRSPWWLADADFVGMRLVTKDGEKNE